MNKQLDLTHAVRWEFRAAGSDAPWLPAKVPGCVHQDLLRAGRIPDPFYGTNELALRWVEETDWDYRGVFTLSESSLEAECIDLVTDGLDTVATVTLNGHLIARTENMFLAHRWPVRAALRPGRNQVHIRFDSAFRYVTRERRTHEGFAFNDPVGGCTRIRKQQCQFGWDWGPRLVTAGIWRGLRLEHRPANRLEHVRVAQHLARWLGHTPFYTRTHPDRCARKLRRRRQSRRRAGRTD